MSLNIDRPCLKKCTLDKNDVCIGCFRTLDDMRCWHSSSQGEKVEMLQLAEVRQKEHKIKQKVS